MITRVANESVVLIVGEVDVQTGYPLYLAALKEAEDGSARVVFDLAGVTFVDSVGLGMIIRSRDDLADRYESRLVLRNPSARVTSLLELTAMTGQFTIDTDRPG